MGKLRVLFHINDPDRWAVAFGNITNLFDDAGEDNVDTVVLANGRAVAAYADAEKVETMRGLSKRGAKFLVCRNSLKKMCSGGTVCISEGSLPPFVSTVPAGITEIIKKQHEGYAYVKP